MHKHLLIPVSLVIPLFTSTYANAIQPTHYALANTITAHNISALQHAITQNTFNAFGLHSTKPANASPAAEPLSNTDDLYGRAPMYGTESMYGEFNSDGTMGRSGGDTPIASLTNIWIDWQHTADKTKYNNHSPIKTNNDMIIAGITGNTSNLGATQHNWGIYTGYTVGEQYNQSVSVESQGGFFGIFNGFYYKNLNLNTNITGGILDNSNDNTFGTDTFTNFWLNGTASISYNLFLHDRLALRPVITTGYTWIKSDDYTSVSGATIDNQDTNIFEFTPEIQLAGHITNNWHSKMYVKYIMNFSHDGATMDNDLILPHLNDTEYFEYGLSINKNIYNSHISATIGRHDGRRYGWFGGINIKYIF